MHVGGARGLEAPPHHPLTLHDCIAIALAKVRFGTSRFDVLSAAQEVRAAQGMVFAASGRVGTLRAFLGQSDY